MRLGFFWVHQGVTFVAAGLEQEPTEGWPEHKALFSMLPPWWDWEQANLCMSPSSAESLFPTALGSVSHKSHPRGLLSLVPDPRAGVPNVGLKPLTP